MELINDYSTEDINEATYLWLHGAQPKRLQYRPASIEVQKKSHITRIYTFLLDQVDPVAIKEYKDHVAIVNLRAFMDKRRKLKRLFK